MRKIVINADYGGFSLTNEMIARGEELGVKLDRFPSIDRNDPILVQIVEEFQGKSEDLRIVEIPDDVEWVVEEYDGYEWVSEKHRRWYANAK